MVRRRAALHFVTAREGANCASRVWVLHLRAEGALRT
jgi:hypothetical protein